jgi:hypothetical protein
MALVKANDEVIASRRDSGTVQRAFWVDLGQIRVLLLIVMLADGIFPRMTSLVFCEFATTDCGAKARNITANK